MTDRYKPDEARAIGEAQAKTGHFGQRSDANGNQRELANSGCMCLDLSRMFPPSGGLHVPGVRRDAQGFRTSS